MLEITRPRGILRPFYSLWFERLVPLLGKLLPGGAAYTYLPASVARFPPAEELAALIRAAGFDDVVFRLLGGSIVALHTGVAAGPAEGNGTGLAGVGAEITGVGLTEPAIGGDAGFAGVGAETQ